MRYESWKVCYPAPLRRPPIHRWPPWTKLPLGDVRRALVRSGLPLDDVRSIVELGAGDCQRILHALTTLPSLNREDLTVTCVDLSPRAVYWGMDEWARLSLGLSRRRLRPRWSMRFLAADALGVSSREIGSPDVLIDWMMFHGLTEREILRYRRLIRELRPRYFILKCFAEPGGEGGRMASVVRGVRKRRWSEDQILELFGDQFALAGPSHYCRERIDIDDGDGPRHAKREYVFASKTQEVLR